MCQGLVVARQARDSNVHLFCIFPSASFSSYSLTCFVYTAAYYCSITALHVWTWPSSACTSICIGSVVNSPQLVQWLRLWWTRDLMVHLGCPHPSQQKRLQPICAEQFIRLGMDVSSKCRLVNCIHCRWALLTRYSSLYLPTEKLFKGIQAYWPIHWFFTCWIICITVAAATSHSTD